MLHQASLAYYIEQERVLNVIYRKGSRAGRGREFFVFSVNQSNFYSDNCKGVYLVGYDFGRQGVRSYKVLTVDTPPEVRNLSIIGFRLPTQREKMMLHEIYAPMSRPEYEYENPYIGTPIWTLDGRLKEEWPPSFRHENFLGIPMKDRVFIGVYPTGIVYADRLIEIQGEWARVAFLSFETLKLEFQNSSITPQMKAFVVEAAKSVQDKKGKPYQITTAGQTITLGWRDKKDEGR